MEVESLDAFTELVRKTMENKDFQEAMKGYHDLVDHGGVKLHDRGIGTRHHRAVKAGYRNRVMAG